MSEDFYHYHTKMLLDMKKDLKLQLEEIDNELNRRRK